MGLALGENLVCFELIRFPLGLVFGEKLVRKKKNLINKNSHFNSC